MGGSWQGMGKRVLHMKRLSEILKNSGRVRPNVGRHVKQKAAVGAPLDDDLHNVVAMPMHHIFWFFCNKLVIVISHCDTWGNQPLEA